MLHEVTLHGGTPDAIAQTNALAVAMMHLIVVFVAINPGSGLRDFKGIGANRHDAVAQLRLLETTDLHGHILPYDYYADTPTETVGLARVATLIRECRREAANTLLFDNGDFLQGNPLTDVLHNELGHTGTAPHAIIGAMNALCYDAVGLGNHEFTFGLDYLSNALGQARFPVVSCNVFRSTGNGATDRPLVHPWTILETRLTLEDGTTETLHVGVIGFTPPQVSQWDSQILGGAIRTKDILTTAQTEVPRLRSEGADLVVALCHSGIGGPDPDSMLENAALPLSRIDGIDVILAGHNHELFPGHGPDDVLGVDHDKATLYGKPAVNAGANGSHLGVIDLTIGREGRDWKIIDHSARLLPIFARHAERGVSALVASDPEIEQLAAPAHQRTLKAIRQPVGRTEVHLHSYFSRVQPGDDVRLVAEAQRKVVDHLLPGTRWEAIPVLSAAAPFKCGGRGGPENYVDIPAGPLTRGHAAELYIYPNTVCAVLVTGADLVDWLERSASALGRLRPGERGQTLVNEAFPSYNFDTVFGVSYEIDLTQPPRYGPNGQVLSQKNGRICNLVHDGRPVSGDQRFVLATNSYRIGGGGHYSLAATAPKVFEARTTTRDALIELFQSTCKAPPSPPPWRIRPVPGATASFMTAPGAARHMADLVAGRCLRFDPGTDGSWVCEIDLDPTARS